jgi:hypothetical protein
MLGLALRFALLHAQAVKSGDDSGEFLLEWEHGEGDGKHSELAHIYPGPCFAVGHAES